MVTSPYKTDKTCYKKKACYKKKTCHKKKTCDVTILQRDLLFYYLQGEASLEEAVLDPPGLWIMMGLLSSLGIMRLNPVALEDLTIFVTAEVIVFGLAPL